MDIAKLLSFKNKLSQMVGAAHLAQNSIGYSRLEAAFAIATTATGPAISATIAETTTSTRTFLAWAGKVYREWTSIEVLAMEHVDCGIGLIL
jgi:hypothetical protein